MMGRLRHRRHMHLRRWCCLLVLGVAMGCVRRPHAPVCHVAILQEMRARAKHMTSEQVGQVATALCAEARRADLDPLLALALLDLESGYDAQALSSHGAMGLMQVMPPTAVAVARRHGLVPPGTGPQDPAFNVTLGIRYLADLRHEFQTLDHALLAYNLGPPAMRALLRTHGAKLDVASQPFVVQVSRRLEALQKRYTDHGDAGLGRR